MARDFQVTVNSAAMEDILKSEEVIKALRDIAEDIVSVHPSPDDLEIEEWVGRNRARVSVKTNSAAAAVREARDHSLVQALGAVQSD